MDGTTDPVIAVIDYPIAGNPTQFALERAFAAMQIELRVLSFEVQPESIGAALDGTVALGFRGVFVDGPLTPLAAKWCQMQADGSPSTPQVVDCLSQSDGESYYDGINCSQAWLAETIDSHFQSRGRSIEKSLVLGNDLDGTLDDTTSLGDIRYRRSLGDPDQIGVTDLIIIMDDSVTGDAMHLDHWPTSDGSTLVIDCTQTGHPSSHAIEAKGYTLLRPEQRRIGTLLKCIAAWTGSQCPVEVITEAVEEYLAI